MTQKVSLLLFEAQGKHTLKSNSSVDKKIKHGHWLFGKLNQLFIKGSYTGTNFLKIE